MSILIFLIIIVGLIVFIGISNEKIFHIQSDIALILFSLIIAIVLAIVSRIFYIPILDKFVSNIGEFGFEEYLMDGVLCFMLFAGASKVNMGKFRANLRPISLLALLTTAVSSFIYGIIFYGIALLFRIPMDIWMCILLGCVVSPTDPIAATGILNKIGLSKNVCSVIENESLFNDGTGVTLFVFVRSIIIQSGDSNFVSLMLKEILGAAAVALIVSFILFKLMEITKDPVRYILISLLDVALVYSICEHMGFSGVIASVVCGMYFSYRMDKMERRVCVIDPNEYYKDFWEILESILNAVLFVMIGLMLLDLKISRFAYVAIPAAVIILLISRSLGVLLSSVLTGRKIPGNYDLKEFVILMTWSALKGGLSLALAMSTAEYLEPDIYDLFMNVTFVTIFFTVLVQGLTIKNVYFRLEKHKADRIKRNSEGLYEDSSSRAG
ncbi:MAG: sodium:proton antiporter [Lachnospiraceae bacterium]|nr:sodium:proton antiporter [Lachnospiraceae bacterium]